MLSLDCRLMWPPVLVTLAFRVRLASLVLPSALSPAPSKMLPVALMPAASVPPTVRVPATVVNTRWLSVPVISRSS